MVVLGDLPPKGESLGAIWSRRMNHFFDPLRRWAAERPRWVLCHASTISSTSAGGTVFVDSHAAVQRIRSSYRKDGMRMVCDSMQTLYDMF